MTSCPGILQTGSNKLAAWPSEASPVERAYLAFLILTQVNFAVWRPNRSFPS